MDVAYINVVRTIKVKLSQKSRYLECSGATSVTFIAEGAHRFRGHGKTVRDWEAAS
jgi:hypothetical protein